MLDGDVLGLVVSFGSVAEERNKEKRTKKQTFLLLKPRGARRALRKLTQLN